MFGKKALVPTPGFPLMNLRKGCRILEKSFIALTLTEWRYFLIPEDHGKVSMETHIRHVLRISRFLTRQIPDK